MVPYLNRLYVCLFGFFQRGLCQKLYLFHFSSRINETWYKVSVIFGSFEIGPIFLFNCHLGSGEVTEVNTCNFVYHLDFDLHLD